MLSRFYIFTYNAPDIYRVNFQSCSHHILIIIKSKLVYTRIHTLAIAFSSVPIWNVILNTFITPCVHPVHRKDTIINSSDNYNDNNNRNTLCVCVHVLYYCLQFYCNYFTRRMMVRPAAASALGRAPVGLWRAAISSSIVIAHLLLRRRSRSL